MKASNRTYVFYNSGLAYDYLTQLPTPQHEMMFGGGLATGGADEFGNVNDAEYCLPIASHLSGALSVYFGEQHWGEEASGDGGEDSEENRWNRGRVKALWSGIEGVSADELPWVGRVPPKLSGRKPVGAVGGPLSSTEKGDDMSIATDSLYSQDNIVPVDLAPPGEWVAAGYTGEGMVHAWMSGKALAQMVLGREGKEDEWFPEIMRITEGRWRKAKVENLMNKFLDN
jgi:glycine/D-amino acid oxidase-like deaminating enzyme